MRTLHFSTPTWAISIRDWAETLSQHMTRREKAILGILCLALIVSGMFSVIGFVDRHTHLVPESGGTYTEAAVGQPRYINPILAGTNDLDLDLTRLAYDSLFTFDNNLDIRPELAEGYDISPSGQQYTVYLREDATWHDGEKFTADDVVFTIRSIQTPDFGSPLANSFQGVTVDKIDDYTVKFTLQQPYAPFLASLNIGIAPKHVWENIQPKNAALAEQTLKPVGTGPFKFSEITTRRKTGEITSMSFVRNDSYYGARPYLDRVAIDFYTTEDDAVRALLAGNADGVGFLPLSMASQARARTGIDIHSVLIPQYFSLFFNDVKNDLLSDAGIRAALSLATDRETIVHDALDDEAEPIHLPIPQDMIDLGDEHIGVTFDPEIAKQNLEEAGWKDEHGDGIREKDGKELRFTITTTDWPEYVHTAELIKEQWAKIGVGVEIESLGAGVIQQTVVGPREYQILLYGEILAADPDPYPFWHSTQTRSPGLNLSLFKDEQVDKLLEEARKTLDQEERRQKYVEFEKRFADLSPAIILYRPYYLFAQNHKVRGQGVSFTNLPAGRFNDIEYWHVRTNRVWGSSEN